MTTKSKKIESPHTQVDEVDCKLPKMILTELLLNKKVRK